MDFNRNDYLEHTETCKIVNDVFKQNKRGGGVSSQNTLDDLLNFDMKEIITSSRL